MPSPASSKTPRPSRDRRQLLGVLPLLFLACSLLASLAEAPPPARRELVDTVAMHRQLMKQVAGLLIQRKFAELDAMAQEFKQDKPVWPDGVHKLDTFYDGVSHSLPELSRTNHLAILEQWCKHSPKSGTPLVALGKTLTYFAWDARGGGWASRVPEDGWRPFADRLAEAHKVLDQARSLDPKDPEACAALITVAMGESWPLARTMQLAEAALKIDPAYESVHAAMAIYLLPRWQGAPGAWAAYADKVVAATKEPHGLAFYPRIARFVRSYSSTHELMKDEWFYERNRMPWPKLKQGLEDWMKACPDAAIIPEFYFAFARMARDQAAIREAVQRIGDAHGTKWTTNVWQWHIWKAWASLPQPTPAPIASTRMFNRAHPTSIAYSADGRQLFVGYGTGALASLDAADLSVLREGSENLQQIQSLAVSPDGDSLAVGIGRYETNATREIRLLNTRNLTTRELTRWRGLPVSLQFSADGRALAVTGGEYGHFGEGVIWDLEKRAPRWPAWREAKGAVFDAGAFMPGTNLFALAQNKSVTLREPGGTNLVGELLKLASLRTTVRALRFSPDGKLLAAGAANSYTSRNSPGDFRVWETQTWQPAPWSPKGLEESGVGDLDFSPDGQLLAVGRVSGATELWDVKAGKQLSLLLSQWGSISGVAFSPDGTRLATASQDGSLRLWDIPAIRATPGPVPEPRMAKVTTKAPPKKPAPKKK